MTHLLRVIVKQGRLMGCVVTLADKIPNLGTLHDAAADITRGIMIYLYVAGAQHEGGVKMYHIVGYCHCLTLPTSPHTCLAPVGTYLLCQIGNPVLTVM